MLRAYELMVIFDGDSTDDAVARLLDQSVALVEAGGGRMATSNLVDSSMRLIPLQAAQTSGFSAGRRRFAYEINHKWEGIYVLYEIVTEASNLDDLERMLRIADEVVRHKLLRLPDKEATKRGLFGEAPATVG